MLYFSISKSLFSLNRSKWKMFFSSLQIDQFEKETSRFKKNRKEKENMEIDLIRFITCTPIFVKCFKHTQKIGFV